MNEYRYIPYKKKLVARAREFRKGSTEAEKAFWEVLKDKQLLNLKFTRQKPLDDFIADFYCAELKLAVEVDGNIHSFQKTRDREKDNILNHKFGIRVKRYSNSDVINNTDEVIKDLLEYISPLTRG